MLYAFPYSYDIIALFLLFIVKIYSFSINRFLYTNYKHNNISNINNLLLAAMKQKTDDNNIPW